MSGILSLAHRDGAPVDPDVAGHCMARLRHRARDGDDLVELPWAVLGHAHFWTTPEERGERQPLHDADAGLHLSFDGRLDNRDEVARSLGLGTAEAAARSDAALVLAALARWDEDALARFLGPFALVLLDGRRRRVLLARDVLGDRGLVYHLGERLLVAASEEAAVLAHPALRDDLDDRRLATFFALREPDDDATFFAAVRQVLPGHGLRVGPDGVRRVRFRSVRAATGLRVRGRDDAAAAYREALDRAVACRLRGSGRVGVLTSGGLDSGPVLATAATLAASPPLAVSWVFDRFAECDERRYIDPLVARYGLEAAQVPCDDALPLSRPDAWPVNPNTASETPYRWMSERVYRAGALRGCRVLLTGLLGDDLFQGVQDWLWSLLAGSGFAAATAGARAHAARVGVRALLRGAVVGPLLPRAVRRLPRAVRRPPRPPGWLSPDAVEALAAPVAPWQPGTAPRPAQLATVASLANADAISYEGFHAHRCGVELRHPFRDLRLVELMLALPSRHLYSGVETRPAVRRAMRDRVPGAVLGRRDKAHYEPLVRAALEAPAEGGVFRRGLATPDALWRRFVRPEWVAGAAPGARFERLEDLVLWKCTWLEFWSRLLLL